MNSLCLSSHSVLSCDSPGLRMASICAHRPPCHQGVTQPMLTQKAPTSGEQRVQKVLHIHGDLMREGRAGTLFFCSA